MKPKNFFNWLRNELGVTESPPFGNVDTELYTLNDDMVEVSIYRNYIIENAVGLGNALVVASTNPPVTIVLSHYKLNGTAVRLGYDNYTDTAFASFIYWEESPILAQEGDMEHD